MDNELNRILELSGMPVQAVVNEDAAAIKSGLAVKVESIMIGVVSEFPPEGSPDIFMDDDANVDNPEVDVAFVGTIGLPILNTTSITRHKASYYEPEDVDDYEEEVIKDVQISISTMFGYDGIQYVTLYNMDGDDHSSMPVTEDTDKIINQFIADIREHNMGIKGGEHTHYASYKKAHAARRDGPDD